MYCKHKRHLLHVSIGQELGAAHFINQERVQETSSHIHTLILSKEMRNLKKRKELEADRKNKNKREQGKQDSRHLQMQYTNREDGNTSSQYQ